MASQNKTYWNAYYNKKKNNDKPSSFALLVSKNYLNKHSVLVDVGSGDGRDTFHLRKKAKYVYSIDESSIAVKKNTLKVKKMGIQNVTFKNLPSNDLKKINTKKINFIYARFFLHAIDENNENNFLKNIKKTFKTETIIALEFRTIKDLLMKKGKKISKYERFTNHYRRFIDTHIFEKKLQKMNFKIIYKKLGINLSKTPNDNPHLCRIIFSITL